MSTVSTAAALAAVERLTGMTGERPRPLGGEAVMVTVADGRGLVAKRGAGAGAARAEAAGLRWLAESGDVPTPAVHGDDEHDGGWLVIDHVEPGAPGPAAADEFGRGLAALHLRGAPAFGSAPPGGPADAWIGLAPMRNVASEEWPEFYARHRVEPYVRTCVDRGIIDSDAATVFDTVCAKLPDLAGDPEPPARLHGDLWSGNVHWATDGRAWLIDPACHGGHRETDLAMLRLFGTPLLERILGAYVEAAQGAAAPLAAGWEERTPLHQLFPLLVHAVLFGGGYVRQALSTAHACLKGR